MELYAIIMSGGRGKRFWPLSQVSLPKQFLTFTGEGSLFAQTFQNLRQIIPASNIFTVTRQTYRSIILDQVKEFLPENIIVEPVQNNTGPCIALGISYVRHFSPDAVVVVLPADHYFDQKESFLKALESARSYAEEKPEIMTFGIKPDFPHTGYGYIEVGELVKSLNGFNINRGVRFVEKPNLETAQKLLLDGHYFWNSGIFCARVEVFQDAFRKYLSVIHKNILNFQPYIGTPSEAHKLFEIYERMPKISFDYGIMEQLDDVAVMPIDVGWNDVGTWSSLRRLHNVDSSENLVLGDHVALDSNGSTVIGEGKVVVIGVENLIVASNGKYVLVCARDKEHHIQDIVDELETNGQ
jgi:mannose-1-phosphate guanylyltransferase